MYYAVADGHPSIAQLIEISETIAEEQRPRSCGTSAEIAGMMMRGMPGAPDSEEFDVIALNSEDEDVHLLLRRKTDGLLARCSFIEGEDLGDDIFVFELVDDQNHERIVGRFDQWCRVNLDEEDEAAYRSFISDMVKVEENPEYDLITDLLLIAPELATLENLNGQVRTKALRDAIANGLASIRTTAGMA